MSYGFEITAEDVFNVLHANKDQLINPHKMALTTLAEASFEEMVVLNQTQLIESAALDSATELDAQTEAAYVEIRKILVEQGLLKA